MMLELVVNRYRFVPFEWGVHDCVLFAARCVDAQRGTTFEAEVYRRFPYNSALGAFRIFQEQGGLEFLVSSFLGDPVEPSRLGLGDVVLVRRPDGVLLLGVCDEELVMVPGERGLEWHPMALAIKGWKACPNS